MCPPVFSCRAVGSFQLYSTLLTSTQIAYLAGAPAQLPAVPKQVAGSLVSWLDSSDSSAVTYSTGGGAAVPGSSRITAVVDKGLAAVTYTPPTAAAQPYYLSSACPMYFDGASSTLTNSAFNYPWSGGSVSIVMALYNVTGGANGPIAYRAPYSAISWGSDGCLGLHMINLNGLNVDFQSCGRGWQDPAGPSLKGGLYNGIDTLAFVATGQTTAGTTYWDMYINGVQVTSWSRNGVNPSDTEPAPGLTFGATQFGSTLYILQGALFALLGGVTSPGPSFTRSGALLPASDVRSLLRPHHALSPTIYPSINLPRVHP